MSKLHKNRPPMRAGARAVGDRRERRGRRGDDGMGLVEVMVAFVILMITLVPMSYLFTTSLISAGQTQNQQTALSIAEQWTETLGNVTPPVNANGEVIVNRFAPPAGPDPGSSTTTSAYAVTTSPVAPATIAVASVSTFAPATTALPQTAVAVTTVAGVSTPQQFTYTGISGNTLTGVSGWASAGSIASGAAITQTTSTVSSVVKGGTTYNVLAEYEWATFQNSGLGSKPNLCVAGTPQLLKVKVQVSWGPLTDVNNVQDSVVLNYPPAGIQTLGFIALQVTGDSTDLDTQSNPWSERVQAPPVTITGPQNLTIYPDSYGCAFAQVLPSTSGYTVSIANATSGILAGSASDTTYGSPSFVANGVAGTVASNELTTPTSVTQTGISVSVGAVTRLSASYDQGSIINLASGSTVSSSATEDGVACPGGAVITCISSGESGTGANAAATMTVFNQTTGHWSAATLPAGVTRIAAEACSATGGRCVAVGYGATTAYSLSSPNTSVTFTADTLPTVSGAAITSLSQVVCPSGTSYCVAIGSTATAGVVLTGTVSASSINWVVDAISGTGTFGGLSNLQCPSAATGCIATAVNTATNPGTPVIVAGAYGLGWTAATSSPTVTFTSVSSLACPSTTLTTTCLIAGRTSAGPALVSGTTSATGLGTAAPTWTWKADALVSGTTTAGTLYCPVSTKCLLTGQTATAAEVMYGATTAGSSVTFAADTPTGVTSVTQIACPTTSACVLIGSTSTAPVISSAAITGATTADTWTTTAPTAPSGDTLSQLTGVVCWSTPSCAVTAVGTVTATSVPTAILYAKSGSPLTTWSSVGLPTANPAFYLGDIDCASPGSTTSYCTAVGANGTGAIELSTNGGPTGTWSDTTPSGLSGAAVGGIPIEINNANLTPASSVNLVTAGWTGTLATPLPPVFPFTSGYSVWAGDCSSEGQTYNSATVATVPGGSSATATVPLGLLAVQVLHSTGASTGLPYAAAALTLTSAAPCAGDNYTLQTTGPDGLSRTEVPYGPYSLKIVTGGGTTTITGITVGGSTVTNGLVPYPVPTPVPVSAT
jgi:Tfp pilus assembly protein PilV